ncbi:MAG TPA: glycosyltransferase [Caulobacteraceae bacterium]|nr:glycosyltransferase [Caulobacteraceae bacterium]
MASARRTRRTLTVMVSPREGHGLAEASLASVLADDALDFDLVYVDVLAPATTAAALAAACAAHGGVLVRHDAWVAPSVARKAALARVETPYVLFIDNDVLVEPGCFARLVACAQETGAGLVAPLYLEGDERAASSIHMAGGVLVRDAAGRLEREEHELAHAPLERAERLARRQIDHAEYHCVLARTDFARRPGVISEDVLLVHEHIDLALKARELGFGVWLEPAARVNYAAAAGRRLGDLDFFRRRWDEAGCDASLAAFARRWPIADPDAFFAGIRVFVRERMARTSPLHPGAAGADRDLPMAPAELAQTRTALREQALGRGYGAVAARALESACDFATLSFDGLYRADGRPFLNHAIGTASALVRYDLRLDVVLAGLLHAAYTHRPPWIDPGEVTRVLASGGADRIVLALPAAKAQIADGASAAQLTLTQAWALAIEAANEADMLLSGEYRASGRPREIAPRGLALLGDVLDRVGTPGLATTAAAPAGEGAQGPLLGFSPLHGSFRLDARNRRLEAVRVNR